MDMTMAQRLQTYIDAELHDASLYQQLADQAPNEDYRRLLLEFSQDEQSHADEFKRIYRTMTGRSYNPVITPPVLEGTFNNILRDRVLDESGDFRKYGLEYLQAERNPVLKNAFYRARTDENVHALRLLDMLS